MGPERPAKNFQKACQTQTFPSVLLHSERKKKQVGQVNPRIKKILHGSTIAALLHLSNNVFVLKI